MKRKACSKSVNRIVLATLMIVFLSAVIGCSSANVYKNPISKYQTAVSKTISTIQPYFVELNSIETEYQLYFALNIINANNKAIKANKEAIKANKEAIKADPAIKAIPEIDQTKLLLNWGTQHLDKGIDSEQIAIRIKALNLISDYTRLLSNIVNSSAPEDIKEAAKSLGENASNLSTTISKIPGASPVPDVGTPLSQIFELVGGLAIQHKQKAAIEKAVLDAEKPITELIEELEKELNAIVKLRRQAFHGIRGEKLSVFNEIRKTTKPEKVDGVIKQIVSMSAKYDTLASVDVTELLREMKSTHLDLVTFVKSDKTPTDISSFADSVYVFATDVENVSNIIQSIHNIK